ncbi:MAG TPA: hypothetical protein VGP82_09920 [Ktedonobacterales bacterium]|nr:hypothetical protein [Ktedonobacterales bacterium]
MLPLLDHFGLVRSPLFYLHPVQPALVLMRAAFAPAQPWQIVYGVLGSAFWLWLAYIWDLGTAQLRPFRCAHGGCMKS